MLAFDNVPNNGVLPCAPCIVPASRQLLLGWPWNVCIPATLLATSCLLTIAAPVAYRSYKEALGVPYLTTGRSEADLLNSRWCLPSISVVDVRVGTTEEGHDHYRFGPTR